MRATLVQLTGGALASAALATQWVWVGGLFAGLFLIILGVAVER